jgi:enoyl-CoA hydratase
MPEPEILCERRGAAGLVRLQRPQALNALTLGMVRALADALERWEHDPAITRIVICAEGERAFCAGGDIRHLYQLGLEGRQAEALGFWREEYRLNRRIKRYAKPYIALIDGIVMGGGVGISLHGSHRVAGERYRFAMPEVGIGFFPDVGATFALPRLPGATGAWLALTGAQIGPDDALALGLATHAAASAQFAPLLAALVAGEEVEATLAAFARPALAAPHGPDRPVIDACFSHASVAEVLAALDGAAAAGSAFALQAARAMRGKSPTSLAIACEQMRRGGALTFDEAILTEFRIVSRLLAGADFYEGVRAAVIDKDARPVWRPGWDEPPTSQAIAAYFAPLEQTELRFMA